MDHADARQSGFHCQTCAIRNRAICGDLDRAELDLLSRIARRRQLKAGETLMWDGDEAAFVANVFEGVLKLSSQTADGREQILGLAFASDFVGRPFGATTPYSAEALSDAVVCVFRRADFEAFSREHPRLEHKLLERTLTELDRTRRWMVLLGRMNAEQKLATFLLELPERLAPMVCAAERSRVDSFELPLSRQQIADVLGLTVETVSRQFSRFRKDGLIETSARRDVRIVDRVGLERCAG